MQTMEKDEKPVLIQSEKEKLPQTMGLREVVSLGVGGTIGGAIFVLVGTAIEQAGPLGALFSFVLAFLVAVVIALPYAELACRYPLAGGGYAFVRAILGRHWGFVMGWVYAGAWLFIGSYVTLGFGGYLQQILSEALPMTKGSTNLPIVYTLLLILGMVLLNLTGGQFFARVQKFIVVLALVALVGAGIAGLYYAVFGLQGATLSHFSLVLPHGVGGVLETASLAFLALSGFDIVATTGEEVRNPQRELPLAILCTLGIVVLLYLLVTTATASVLSGSQLNTKTPLADAAMHLFGGPGQQFIALTAILTTAATGNALLAATSRITFAMARDGLLPRFLAHLHPSTKAPWTAILANGVIFLLFALTNSINTLAIIGSFLYVLQFVFPLVALIVVRARSKTLPAFRTPAPNLILPLACGGCCLLLYASGASSMEAGAAWLAAGLAIYAGLQGFRNYTLKKQYMKKGYVLTTEAIALLKGQINRMLNDSQAGFEQLEATQTHIDELKQLRTIQARIEELEQLRSSQARIEELKQLRNTQARVEELELLQSAHARIEDLKVQRATQVHTAELKFLQTTQVQPSKGGGVTVLENSLSEIEKERQRSQELTRTTQRPTHRTSRVAQKRRHSTSRHRPFLRTQTEKAGSGLPIPISGRYNISKETKNFLPRAHVHKGVARRTRHRMS